MKNDPALAKIQSSESNKLGLKDLGGWENSSFS
jgi:hypothetical protein